MLTRFKSTVVSDLGKAAVILFASAIIASLFNFLHPMRLPIFPKDVTEPGTPEFILKQIVYVEPREAYETFGQNPGVLVDVRERKEYLYNRAKDAVSLPYLGYEEYIGGFERHTPKDAFIYLYDHGGDIDLSTRVAKRLILRGFKRVSVIRGGILAWVRAGLPMDIALSGLGTNLGE